MAKTITGQFLTPNLGGPNNNGVLYLQLSQDANLISGGGQVCPTLVKIQLDASGNIPGGTQIFANDELTPAGTQYLIVVNDSGGGRIYGPETFTIAGASPINLNTLVP